MKRRLLILVLAVALLPAACGTPAGLEQTMERFGEAAAKNEQALKDLDQTASQRLTEIRQEQAVKGRNANGQTVLVRSVKSADCTFEAPGCELRLMTRDEEKESPAAGEELTINSLIPNQLAVAHEISLYAAGLTQIATADQTESVRKGVETAMTGVCGLAGTLGAISGAGLAARPACEAFRAPIGSLAAFLYGEYQAHAKLSALRHATNEMQPLLKQAVDAFSISAESAIDGDVRHLTERYDSASKNWEDSRTEANLKALLDAANHLDGALQARAALKSKSSVFRAFETAHEALVEALRTKDMDLSAVMVETERLVSKAKELARIAQDFKAAMKSSKKLKEAGVNRPESGQ